jgi:CBS domain-containing protein
VALLGRNPTRPLHELLIAAAGPLVNVVIIALLFPLSGLSVGLDDGGRELLQGSALAPSFATLVTWLMGANIALVVFNLIPAFPLDGGRMFRAILAMFMSFRRATRVATALGQLIAIILGVFGVLSGNLALVLVAVFIFFGAGQENAEGQARTVLTTLRVGDAYNKYALTLAIGDRVSKVVSYILMSYQPDFAVLQGGNLLGIVTREDVLRALAADTRDVYVTGIMRREVAKVEASATLDEVRLVMAEKGARVVAVYDGAVYLGLVSREDISEAFAVLAFLQRQQEARRVEQASASSN